MNFKQLFLTTAITLAATSAFAGNKYSYQAASAGHTGYYEMQTNPEKYRVLWQRYLGTDDAEAEFTNVGSIYDGVAYYAFDEVFDKPHDGSRLNKRLIGVDTETGKTLWKIDEKGQGGIEAPMIGDGKLFYTIGNNVFSKTKALDPKTGKVLYSMPDIGEFIPYESSLYARDNGMFVNYHQADGKRNWLMKTKDGVRHFAISHDYIVAKDGDNSIHVFNRNDGSKAFDVSVPDMFYWENIVRELVLDDRTNTVYTLYSPRESMWTASLYAIDLNQRAVRWVVPGLDVNAQPVVAGDHVYTLIGRYESRYLGAINAVTGQVEWSWTPPEDDKLDIDVPAVTSDVIFVQGLKRTYAISLSTHKTVWQIDQVGRLALGDDKLLILSKRPGSRQDFDYVTAVALK